LGYDRIRGIGGIVRDKGKRLSVGVEGEKVESPLPETYWVEPRLFLAGEYPREPAEGTSRWRLRRLLTAGVQVFIDLTQPGEFGLKPYAELLLDEADGLGLLADYQSFPVVDKNVPSPEQMAQILDVLDRSMQADRGVYVHCYAGIGRTGTVVGCYLVRHGLHPQHALDRIAHLRRGSRYAWIESPETMVQRKMVMGWGQGQ
jgi:hypothetical protein